jgi:hypothetical protein
VEILNVAYHDIAGAEEGRLHLMLPQAVHRSLRRLDATGNPA